MNKEFLRRSPLFTSLAETDLEWLSQHIQPVSIRAGETLIQEGAPGDSAYIIIDGEFEVIKKSDQQEIVIGVREPGAVIGEMALIDNAPRSASVRAVKDGNLLKINADVFFQLISTSATAVMAILQTVSLRLRQNEAMLRQSEKMAALGTLAAGLAHELNNPAAAARRSADLLQTAITNWQQLTSEIDKLGFKDAQLERLNTLRIKLTEGRSKIKSLDPLTQGDLEGEMQTWLEGLGLEDAWELAPTLVAGGWDKPALMKSCDIYPPEQSRVILRWLAAGDTVYSLLDEVHMSTERISEIVRSVRVYSYLDQAPIQEVNIHESLDNTLIILRHKTRDGIKVTRQYAADLPHIEAYGSELNQVWTNILDNAIDALQGEGDILLRTYAKDGNVFVEIQDNGPGIPPEIQKRIFEPFFTTKPPGVGTGLGLHISYTIVHKHHGQIQLSSRPGETCFQVKLPIQLPRNKG